MTNDDLLRGFNSIRNSLTEDERSVIEKITGKTKPDLNIETFFQCLKTYQNVYKFPNWEGLSTDEKELLGRKVYNWYLTLIMFSSDFWKRFSYTAEDDLKLQIIIKGSKLKIISDFIHYQYFLQDKLQECFDNNFSPACIKWIEIEIEKTNQRMNSLSENNQGETKAFPDYLLHGEREKLALRLKEEFKNEKGKTIRLMIEVLKDKGILPQLDRKRKQLYNSIHEYFNNYIGTYNSIFNRNPEDPKNSKIERLKRLGVEQRINTLLNDI